MVTFGTHDIPLQIKKDNGEVLNPTYESENILNDPILDPDWKQLEMTTLEEISKPVIEFSQI